MMATKKDVKKYKCKFCGHKEIYIGNVRIFEGFELTKELESDKNFMQAFNRAVEIGTICHY